MVFQLFQIVPDDEVVEVPKDKVVRKVGVYHYQTKMELDKTVSVIKIMDR